MKQADVTPGTTYLVKVSGTLARVRVDRLYASYRGRLQFEGVNLRTGRTITGSPARLRKVAP